MELFKSLENKTKNFNDPFQHFEINEPLTEEAIKEISNAEKEILDLKNKSPEKIRKIAVETSSDLIKQLIGVEVNNSSISAIVEDVSRKTN